MSQRILVVEDEAPVRLLLDKMLSTAGYEVISVPDGITALKAVRTNPPDLVLCDLTMPNIDGYSLIAMLKRDRSFKAPIVVLSGRVRDKDVKAAMDAGADAYLAKPIGRDDLLSKVAEHLRPLP